MKFLLCFGIEVLIFYGMKTKFKVYGQTETENKVSDTLVSLAATI